MTSLATVPSKQLSDPDARILTRSIVQSRRELPVFSRFIGGAKFCGASFNRMVLLELQRLHTAPGKILVVLPPQHGKSRIVLEFISWIFGNDPNAEIALAAGNEDKILNQSRAIRNRIAYDPRYRAVFATGIHKTEQRATFWRTRDAGWLQAMKIGHQAKGGRMLIVDEPFDTWQEAQSASNREFAWNWFQSTRFSRMHPSASTVVICSRMHWHDLAGRIKRSGENDWSIIELPALRKVEE